MIPAGMARSDRFAGPVRSALRFAAAILFLLASPVSAQDARDRQSAAEAFDRGTAAFLARDYARAAEWFETAHRLAPASAALVQAVRMHERAGNALRAATLALRLQALYENDRNAQRAAAQALEQAGRFVRVDVQCDACTIQLDGTLVEHPSFFVQPGVEHTVEASFEYGTRSANVRGGQGERRAIRFETPDAPPDTPDPDPDPADPDPEPDPIAPSQPTPPAPSEMPIPMWVTITGIVLTAGLGGVSIWSGVDTLDGVPAYEMSPTPEALADGQAREARTNWLIIGTSVLAATTLVLAILTDWDGESAPDVQAGVSIQPDGALAGLRGRF
jgi:tetratricopeptide (TPR) repeat protein